MDDTTDELHVEKEEDNGETLSGFGIWTGLLPIAREASSEYGDGVDDETMVQYLDRQLERYQWFASTIDDPRPLSECARTLSTPPRRPADWERALVEISRIGTARAETFLRTWQPPEEALELDLLRRICTVKCARRVE